jgi:hypothetical protein
LKTVLKKELGLAIDAIEKVFWVIDLRVTNLPPPFRKVFWQEGFDGDLSGDRVIPNKYRYKKRYQEELYIISHQASPNQTLLRPELKSGLGMTRRGYFFVSNKCCRPI